MKSQLQLNMQGRFTILEGRTCVFAVSTDNDCLRNDHEDFLAKSEFLTFFYNNTNHCQFRKNLHNA